MKLRGKMIVAFGAVSMLVGSVTAQNLQRGAEFLDAGMYGCAKVALLEEVKTTPSAEAFYLLGDTYLMLGDFSAAAENFSKCLSLNPEYVLGKVGEGKLKLMQKDSAGAEVIFAEAVKNAKKNPAIFNAIAQAYYLNGMFDKAALMLDTSFKVKKNNPEGYVIKGDMLFKEKKYNEALLEYQQAIYFDENNKGALLRTARAYTQVNRDVTIQSLDKIESIDYQYTPAHVEAAEYYYSVLNFEDAIHQFEKFVNIPGASIVDRQNYVASLYFSQQYDKSLEEGAKVLADDPKNFVVRRIQMYNNFDKGNTELAVEQASEFFANRGPADTYILTDYVVYANMMVETKDYAGALQAYKTALEIDPKKVEMYKEISAMYDKLDDYENSIINLKEFLAKGKPNAADYFSFGRTYYQAAAKVKSDSVANKAYLGDAVVMFDSVIVHNPDHYLGYLWKARSISSLDPEFKYGPAKEAYEVAAVKVAAANADGTRVRELSECYRYLGNYYYNVVDDTPKALEYFNKIIEIDPNNAQMKEAIKQLSK